MAKVDRFEDLDVWKNARILAKAIYSLAQKGPLSKDFGLRDQTLDEDAQVRFAGNFGPPAKTTSGRVYTGVKHPAVMPRFVIARPPN